MYSYMYIKGFSYGFIKDNMNINIYCILMNNVDGGCETYIKRNYMEGRGSATIR